MTNKVIRRYVQAQSERPQQLFAAALHLGKVSVKHVAHPRWGRRPTVYRQQPITGDHIRIFRRHVQSPDKTFLKIESLAAFHPGFTDSQPAAMSPAYRDLILNIVR